MSPSQSKTSASGFCNKCGKVHSLSYGAAGEYALRVIEEFRTEKRMDYLTPPSQANPDYGFDVLLPGDRGHMFGILECSNAQGESVFLRAFSSLGTGVRDIPGWVPYILKTSIFEEVVLPRQKEIKRLTGLRNQLPPGDLKRREIEKQRREISRTLMPKIHNLYHLNNFRNECRPLAEVFWSDGGIPGGVGDCCAPKMLNFAAVNNLTPVSLAEFYWGGPNKSGRKQPGQFFEACKEKCQPILGFMLCGSPGNE